MKIIFFCFNILLAIFISSINCLVYIDVIKFGEENSLNCSVGHLYILHCEVQCMNEQSQVIHKNCLEEIEKKCSGSKCLYYFDYKNKKKNSLSLRNKNSIEIDECVDSNINEVKTSTTCLIGTSFLLEELYVQYSFFIKNKNNDPVVCKNGIINVKSATLHSPFCEIKLKDISSHIRKKCDGKKECIINPFELPESVQSEDNSCYINNSYVSLSVVCNREIEDGNEREEEEVEVEGEEEEVEVEGEEEEGEGKGEEREEGEGEGEDEKEKEKEKENEDDSNEVEQKNKNEDESECEDENEKANKEFLLYLNNKKVMKAYFNIKCNLVKKKNNLSIKIKKEFSKKNIIFKKLADAIYGIIDKKYESSDIQDLLEDKYNENKRSANHSLYFDFLVDTLKIKDSNSSNLNTIKLKLLYHLKLNLRKLEKVESKINELRKKYIYVCNEAESYALKIVDEDSDDILNYGVFPHNNGMISSEIFFKYTPDFSSLNFEEMDEKKKLSEEELRELKELEKLEIEEKKIKIKELRNKILQRLKALYIGKNETFDTQARCIKAYCYKNQLNLKNLKVILKDNYYSSKKNMGNVLVNIVHHLNTVGDNKNAWSSMRIINKLKVLLYQGYKLVKEKEIEINKEKEKYAILYDIARSNNLDGIFIEKEKIINKNLDLITPEDKQDDEVFGSQSSTFEFLNKIDESSEEKEAKEDGNDSIKDKEKDETDGEDKENETDEKGNEEMIEDEKEDKEEIIEDGKEDKEEIIEDGKEDIEESETDEDNEEIIEDEKEDIEESETDEKDNEEFIEDEKEDIEESKTDEDNEEIIEDEKEDNEEIIEDEKEDNEEMSEEEKEDNEEMAEDEIEDIEESETDEENNEEIIEDEKEDKKENETDEKDNEEFIEDEKEDIEESKTDEKDNEEIIEDEKKDKKENEIDEKGNEEMIEDEKEKKENETGEKDNEEMIEDEKED
ncbi:surface protein P113, putative [Plasmodium relictum]|uniref:Surface protein P113, putative n=1 Tax=Plasmodium relictum TaxID=85471 RepID=A0A1J1HDS0_PLARL|nr:surface protein P113, putative [Plasmodium relictum]CRH03935.1 surface protein P113, putative [Plasmodium relictum]